MYFKDISQYMPLIQSQLFELRFLEIRLEGTFVFPQLAPSPSSILRAWWSVEAGEAPIF
jgi:hypothetical protein